MPDVVDLHIGGRLRTRRRELGLTLEAVGQCTGIRFQQIQKYERGRNRIAASTLLMLAAALEVDAAYFFEGLPRGEVLPGVVAADEVYVSAEPRSFGVLAAAG